MQIDVEEGYFARQIIEKFQKPINDSIEYANERVKIELSKMYDEIIRQYYLYKTQSYYRHGVGIGTGTGENLYRSNDIRLEYDHGIAEYLILDINSNDMEPYKSHFPKEYVLNNVLNGIRGVERAGNSLNGRFMFFHDEFEAKDVKFWKYFYSGKPIKILEQIVSSDIVKSCQKYYLMVKFNELTKHMR